MPIRFCKKLPFPYFRKMSYKFIQIISKRDLNFAILITIASCFQFCILRMWTNALTDEIFCAYRLFRNWQLEKTKTRQDWRDQRHKMIVIVNNRQFDHLQITENFVMLLTTLFLQVLHLNPTRYYNFRLIFIGCQNNFSTTLFAFFQLAHDVVGGHWLWDRNWLQPF